MIINANGDQIMDVPPCPRESPHYFQIIDVLYYIEVLNQRNITYYGRSQ